ncbi:MAG TPA: 30S ribosomal protein S20 [Thermodesulfovibrio thiophilus]|uniref:30S ribosomal protein S20 n=1 Tax=Thermodesulfovibrio thiophilus TaxID=340095 RepID=UPI000401CB49|nr:30S ribosomal protein S20 [Thermodesulfovibrio thiophilus]HHW21193.1 30S ribosomal protein S20 [Thermodesulfovibrio thiophilus]HOA82432.1 30S ribosomal protein S20 [Thermodesulfovibrio thiophilus]HQA04046.1 30S ribosomal protein S20 [Thermodesulfovibrio thiophilus]HQD36204.1 30S ribosomal protein S20 [Thermodesulfovibrio thiophilus]
MATTTKRSTVKKRSRSVLKRIRQNETRRLRNQAWRTQIKTCVKKVEETIEKNDRDSIQAVLNETIKTISKAASKGVIHKNTASRKISRLVKKVNNALQLSMSSN